MDRMTTLIVCGVIRVDTCGYCQQEVILLLLAVRWIDVYHCLASNTYAPARKAVIEQRQLNDGVKCPCAKIIKVEAKVSDTIKILLVQIRMNNGSNQPMTADNNGLSQNHRLST